MVNIISEEISEKIKLLFKNGDFDAFKELYNNNQLDANSFLFSKIRKSSYPLIKLVLSGKYNNKNYLGKLKTAKFLLDEGANPNVCAPYGLSTLGLILHEHNWLSITRAKYEVYLHTIILAHELVKSFAVDVNLLGKGYDYDIDNAIYIYELHKSRAQDELAKVTLSLINKMLEKGATGEKLVKDSEFSELNDLIKRSSLNKNNTYSSPIPHMPDFDSILDHEKVKLASTLWQSENDSKMFLHAVKILQDRAFLHAGWGFGQIEDAATLSLTEFVSKLGKEHQKQAKKNLKIISNPKKPCYLKEPYQYFYALIVE